MLPFSQQLFAITFRILNTMTFGYCMKLSLKIKFNEFFTVGVPFLQEKNRTHYNSLYMSVVQCAGVLSFIIQTIY